MHIIERKFTQYPGEKEFLGVAGALSDPINLNVCKILLEVVTAHPYNRINVSFFILVFLVLILKMFHAYHRKKVYTIP